MLAAASAEPLRTMTTVIRPVPAITDSSMSQRGSRSPQSPKMAAEPTASAPTPAMAGRSAPGAQPGSSTASSTADPPQK